MVKLRLIGELIDPLQAGQQKQARDCRPSAVKISILPAGEKFKRLEPVPDMIRESRPPDLSPMPGVDADYQYYRGPGTCREPQGRTSDRQDFGVLGVMANQPEPPSPIQIPKDLSINEIYWYDIIGSIVTFPGDFVKKKIKTPSFPVSWN